MNIRILFTTLCIVFSAQFITAQKSYDALVYEGNKSFDNKKYSDATSKYLDAIQKNQSNFSAHYNLGNALYKDGKFEEAQAEYTKAQQLAKNSDDKAAALNNLGNAHMKLNQPEKAAEFYKKSLKQKPNNESTRKNFEIAKLKQEQKDKKNSKDDQKDKPNQKQEGDKKEEDKKQGGNKEEDKKEKGKQPNGNDKGDDQKGDAPTENKKKEEDGKNSIPKDLENAILNRASNKERETARRILNKNSNSVPLSNDKDW
jgi:Ca-activated chloride channel family protein